jgi:hypothetical protein
MAIDFEKVAEAIEKSSQEIKDLMFSAELADKIGIIAEENKLEEEIAFKFIDEVGYVILSLKSRSSFFDSLVGIGIDKNIASLIAKNVDEKIFSELDKIKNKIQEIPPEDKIQPKEMESKKENQSGVGQSFEQIILNQARAMQPARPAGYVPQNLPTNEPKPTENVAENIPIKQEEEHAIHNYVPGADPYREPIE